MHGVLGAIAWIALFLTPAGAGAQDIERLLPGVVKLVALPEGGSERTGTGIIVKIEAGAAYILTASHVIEGDPAPRVEFHGRRGRFVRARTLHLEGGQDNGLALLLVEGSDNLPAGLTSLRLSSSSPRIGESVSAIGHPAGRDWQVINVNVAGRAGKEITLSQGLDEGNSGGPLLKADEVVGVVTTVGQLGYATPSLIAQIYLDGNGVNVAAQSGGGTSGPRTSTPPSGQPERTATSGPADEVKVRTVGGVEYYEVDFSRKKTAAQVCQAVNKAHTVFATDPAVCQAFHPDAAVVRAKSGDRAVAYCTGREEGVCGTQKSACVLCPGCKFGIAPDEAGSALYAMMYTACGADGGKPMDDQGHDMLGADQRAWKAALIGQYENHLFDQGGKSDWHYVTLSDAGGNRLTWSNRAKVAWTLVMTADRRTLTVETDSPYHASGYRTAAVEWNDNGTVKRLRGPGDEWYDRVKTASSESDICAGLVQGKVAWNRAGSKSWNPDNIRKLCAGTTDAKATIHCFEEGIRLHNDWARAVSVCAAKR